MFEEGSGRIKNANLLDYKLLRAADFPLRGEVIYGDSYDPVGPFGARSAGEAPAAAAGPAIAQAVYNAIASGGHADDPGERGRGTGSSLNTASPLWSASV